MRSYLTLLEQEMKDERALALVNVVLDSGVVVKFALKIVQTVRGLSVEWTRMGDLLRRNLYGAREDVPAEMADAAVRAYLDDPGPEGPKPAVRPLQRRGAGNVGEPEASLRRPAVGASVVHSTWQFGRQ